MKDIFAHIRPNTRITWNHVGDAYFVTLDNLGMASFTGDQYARSESGDNTDKLTIFTSDASSAILLCGTLQVIRQRITNSRDEAVDKGPKLDATTFAVKEG